MALFIWDWDMGPVPRRPATLESTKPIPRSPDMSSCGTLPLPWLPWCGERPSASLSKEPVDEVRDMRFVRAVLCMGEASGSPPSPPCRPLSLDRFCASMRRLCCARDCTISAQHASNTWMSEELNSTKGDDFSTCALSEPKLVLAPVFGVCSSGRGGAGGGYDAAHAPLGHQ